MPHRNDTPAAAVPTGLQRRSYGCTRLTAALLAAAGVFSALGPTGTARAEPLSSQACLALELEREALSELGAPNLMARGPEWAKRNLIASEREMVQRYLAIEGELKFRCGKQVLDHRSGS